MYLQENEAANSRYAWCKFEARQQHSIIIEYIVLVLQLGILGVVAIAINRAKRLGKLNQLSNIYKLIFAWLICFFVRTLINIIAYFQYIGLSVQNPDNQSGVKTPLKVMSSMFFLFDLLTTFFLQTAMIYIPYLWICNALKAATDAHFSLQEETAVSYRIKVRNVIKKYMLVRQIYPLLYITLCLLLILVDNFYVYTRFLWIIATIQSLVIICVYYSGYLTYCLLKNRLFLDKKALKSMLIQYLILMSCCLVRIIINTIFYFSSLIDYEPDANCYDNHDSNQTTYLFSQISLNSVFLGVGLILMQLIPGLLILYVYWPSEQSERSLTDSLLVQQNRNVETFVK